MSDRHAIYPRLGLTLVRLPEDYSVRDFRHDVASVRSSPLFDTRFGILVDTSGLRSSDIDLITLLAFRDSFLSLRRQDASNVHLGILAPTDLGFGMARMVETLLDDEPQVAVGVFGTPETTLTFLGVATERAPDLGFPSHS